MIKVYAKDHLKNGIRNQHCCNVEPYGGYCKHMGHWQEGGGWSPKTYIYCDALHRKVYLEPDIPNEKQIHERDYYYLLPDNCELLRPKGQMSMFELLMEG